MIVGPEVYNPSHDGRRGRDTGLETRQLGAASNTTTVGPPRSSRGVSRGLTSTGAAGQHYDAVCPAGGGFASAQRTSRSALHSAEGRFEKNGTHRPQKCPRRRRNRGGQPSSTRFGTGSLSWMNWVDSTTVKCG